MVEDNKGVETPPPFLSELYKFDLFYKKKLRTAVCSSFSISATHLNFWVEKLLKEKTYGGLELDHFLVTYPNGVTEPWALCKALRGGEFMDRSLETQRVREAVNFLCCTLTNKPGYENMSDLWSEVRVIDAMNDDDTQELNPLKKYLEELKGVRNEAKDLGEMLTTLIDWVQE